MDIRSNTIRAIAISRKVFIGLSGLIFVFMAAADLAQAVPAQYPTIEAAVAAAQAIRTRQGAEKK